MLQVYPNIFAHQISLAKSSSRLKATIISTHLGDNSSGHAGPEMISGDRIVKDLAVFVRHKTTYSMATAVIFIMYFINTEKVDNAQFTARRISSWHRWAAQGLHSTAEKAWWQSLLSWDRGPVDHSAIWVSRPEILLSKTASSVILDWEILGGIPVHLHLQSDLDSNLL